MGIDFYDRMWEEEQKEKERFGQRKNEIENELFNLKRKVQDLTEEKEKLEELLYLWYCQYNEQMNILDKETSEDTKKILGDKIK